MTFSRMVAKRCLVAALLAETCLEVRTGDLRIKPDASTARKLQDGEYPASASLLWISWRFITMLLITMLLNPASRFRFF
jgi:hypothetical protein